MNSAKGPKSLHSPSSAPGREVSLSVELGTEVAMAAAIDAVLEGMRSDADETIIRATSVGNEAEAAVRIESGTSSGRDI